MITEHGKALVDLLSPAFAPMHVERTPNDPRTYVLKSQHGAILVGYAGREYDDPERPSEFGVREIRWALTIMKKNVRRYGGQDGVEELLDSLGSELTAWRHGRFIYHPAEDGFEDFDVDTGIWSYIMTVTGRRVSELESTPV